MANIYSTLQLYKYRLQSLFIYLINSNLAIIVTLGVIYFLRASSYIINPQLYAEDGYAWLSDAYNNGLSSIFTPLNSFFHLTERIFGYIISKIPLQFAPFLFNITALVIFCIFVAYLFSSRTKILKGNFQRLFVLLSIALIANVEEFFFNFSNSIFILGIIGALVIIANKSINKYIIIFEKIIFTLTCFTLPFCFLYLPILLIEKFKYKRNQTYFLIISLIGCLFQFSSYIISNIERSSVTTKALLTSKYTIIEIYNQIIIPATRFGRIDFQPQNGKIELFKVFLIFISVILISFSVLLKSNKQTVYLLLFFFFFTIASLKSPIVISDRPESALEFMSIATGGDRYFIYGIIGIYVIMAKFLSLNVKQTIIYPLLIFYIVFGILTSYQTKSLKIEKKLNNYTSQYNKGIRQLQTKNNNVDIIIPENPKGFYIRFNSK